MNQLDVAVAGCDALRTLAVFLVDVQFFSPLWQKDRRAL